MHSAMLPHVGAVDAMHRFVGRSAIYVIFALTGVVLSSVFSKAVIPPALWTLEIAQVVMVACCMIGGPHAIQMGSHVRGEPFCNTRTLRQKARGDTFTVFSLLFCLGALFCSALGSTACSPGCLDTEPLHFFTSLVWTALPDGFDAAGELIGIVERSPTAWRPFLWPVQTLLCIGVCLMLLHCLAEFLHDLLRRRGIEA